MRQSKNFTQDLLAINNDLKMQRLSRIMTADEIKKISETPADKV